MKFSDILFDIFIVTVLKLTKLMLVSLNLIYIHLLHGASRLRYF